MQQAIALVTDNPARTIGRPASAGTLPGNAATFTIIRCSGSGAWRAAGIVRDGRLRAQFEDFAKQAQPALV